MASFSMYTRISIEIYAVFPGDTTDFTAKYKDLPPFLGKGLVVRPNDDVETSLVNPNLDAEVWELESFDPDQISIPSGISIPDGSTIYTAHEIVVSNSSLDTKANPCLQEAPTISEALPSLTNGITDSQGISFTLLDPSLSVFFGSDFISTNSRVVMSRLCQKRDKSGYTATNVFVGFITDVSHTNTSVSVSVRNQTKQLDQPATFGFEDELVKWNITDYKIPIISAMLIPYSISVQKHTPQLVAPYPRWRSNYKGLFLSIQEKQRRESEEYRTSQSMESTDQTS